MDKQSTRPNEQNEEAGSVLDLLRNALEQYNPRLWTERNISTERGKPLEFANRPWLKQIYDDHHPRITVQKAAQIGATMWAFTQAVYEAAVHGRTCSVQLLIRARPGCYAAWVSAR